MIRYYDAVATDGGGINIAELMAKQGVKTDGNLPVSVPEITIETTQTVVEPTEVKPEPQPPVAETAKEEVRLEAPSVPPNTIEEVKPLVAEATPPRPVEIDWKEVLKQQPEVEVYKHLGLDEKMINFLSRWRGGEDLKDYLEAATTDYSKMPAEEIMRRYYSNEFRGLSPEDFEELYKMKVVEHYKLDPDVFDEKEVRRGKLLLNYEADKIRQEFVGKQQGLLFSKPPEPPASTAEAAAQQAERESQIATYKGLIEKDTYTQDLFSKKMMPVGEGEEAFNYEVNSPKDYLDVLYDPSKWASKIFNQDGSPNVKKQILLAAIVSDDGFLTNYAKHHQKLGAKRAVELIENASKPMGTPSNEGNMPSDPVAALAKNGVITSGV